MFTDDDVENVVIEVLFKGVRLKEASVLGRDFRRACNNGGLRVFQQTHWDRLNQVHLYFPVNPSVDCWKEQFNDTLKESVNAKGWKIDFPKNAPAIVTL